MLDLNLSSALRSDLEPIPQSLSPHSVIYKMEVVITTPTLQGCSEDLMSCVYKTIVKISGTWPMPNQKVFPHCHVCSVVGRAPPALPCGSNLAPAAPLLPDEHSLLVYQTEHHLSVSAHVLPKLRSSQGLSQPTQELSLSLTPSLLGNFCYSCSFGLCFSL